MKITLKLFILILIFSFRSQAYAQISVGGNAEKITPEKIQKFKNSTLIFVYRQQDSLKDLEKVFKESWTFTKYKLMSYREFKNTQFDSSYSFFTIQPEHIKSEHNKSHYTEFNYVYVYLNLYMNESGRKGTFKDPLARIELYPEISVVNSIRGSNSLFINIKNTKRDPKVLKGEENVLTNIYTKAQIYNLNTAYLKNYLKVLNELFEQSKLRRRNEDTVDSSEVTNLKNNTLYIPDYVLYNYENDSQDEIIKHDIKQLMESYTYKYEFISESDLKNKILYSEQSIYYLLFTQSPKEKFFNIFNSKTGKIIYSESQSKTYHLKPSDFKKIQEAIDNKKQ